MTEDERRFLDAAAIAAMAALITADQEVDYRSAASVAFEHADEMLVWRRKYDK